MSSLGWGIIAALAVVAVVTVLLTAFRPHRKRLGARIQSRHPLEIPVHLRIGEHELDVVSADISRGGMCLKSDVQTSAGQPCELEFALPGQPKMLLYAVVRWRDNHGLFGVLFDLQDHNRRTVAAWVDQRFPQSVQR
jgi:hypothetical protein